jgi:putative hydrolase of HD superfamily
VQNLTGLFKMLTPIQKMYDLILEMDHLKIVLRNTLTKNQISERSVEHAWSTGMIALILMEQLKKEFPEIDELKIVKLCMIHDTVAVYSEALNHDPALDRKKIELEAIKKLMAVHPEFGKGLYNLWEEYEKRQTLEAKIAKAADEICPIFQMLHAKQAYAKDVTAEKLSVKEQSYFDFSETFTALFEKLKMDLLTEGLIR